MFAGRLTANRCPSRIKRGNRDEPQAGPSMVSAAVRFEFFRSPVTEIAEIERFRSRCASPGYDANERGAGIHQSPATFHRSRGNQVTHDGFDLGGICPWRFTP